MRADFSGDAVAFLGVGLRAESDVDVIQLFGGPLAIHGFTAAQNGVMGLDEDAFMRISLPSPRSCKGLRSLGSLSGPEDT